MKKFDIWFWVYYIIIAFAIIQFYLAYLIGGCFPNCVNVDEKMYFFMK